MLGSSPAPYFNIVGCAMCFIDENILYAKWTFGFQKLVLTRNKEKHTSCECLKMIILWINPLRNTYMYIERHEQAENVYHNHYNHHIWLLHIIYNSVYTIILCPCVSSTGWLKKYGVSRSNRHALLGFIHSLQSIKDLGNPRFL